MNKNLSQLFSPKKTIEQNNLNQIDIKAINF